MGPWGNSIFLFSQNRFLREKTKKRDDIPSILIIVSMGGKHWVWWCRDDDIIPSQQREFNEKAPTKTLKIYLEITRENSTSYSVIAILLACHFMKPSWRASRIHGCRQHSNASVMVNHFRSRVLCSGQYSSSSFTSNANIAALHKPSGL